MTTRRTPVEGFDSRLQRLRPTVSAHFSPAAVANPAQGPSRLDQLADALGKWGQVADRYPAYQAAQAQETRDGQKEVLGYYAELYDRARSEGPVSEEQVRQMFPELDPEVSALIAKDMGSRDARAYTQQRVQELLQNDELRLNTPARLEYLQQIREDAQELYGDSPHFATGFLERMEASLSQHELRFMQETATHHKAVVADEFTNRVLETIADGGDLLVLDQEYAQGSPLTHLERNQVVIEAYQQAAIADRNPDLIETIPHRFLNAQTRAEVPQVRQKIRDAIFQEIVQEERLTSIMRDEELRTGKMEVLERIAQGEIVNSLDYRDNPELEAYARQFANQPRLDRTESVYNAQTFKTRLLRAGFSGDYMRAFSDDPAFASAFSGRTVTEDALRDHLLGRPDLNPQEKQDLLEELPTMMEGMSAMRDEDVRQPLNDVIKPMLQDLANSTNAEIQRILTGRNLRARAMQSYENDIRAGFMAYYEDHGQWPRGTAKLQIVRDATERAAGFIERTSSLIPQEEPDRGPVGGRSNAAQSTRSSSRSNSSSRIRPVTPEDIDWLKANDTPDNRARFQRTFGYLPEDLD